MTHFLRTGTSEGPAACIEASSQVELYDILLEKELPAGRVIAAEPWDGEEATLETALTGLANMRLNTIKAEHFQFSSAEHGILPVLRLPRKGDFDSNRRTCRFAR